MKEKWNVAIYARVSTDNDSQETSIDEQIEIMKRWIADKKEDGQDYTLIDTYIDDGVSGSSLDRVGIQRLLRDIDTKKINMILVKDLSRLSRNYINIGDLIENAFQTKEVRLVAVQDNVDSKEGLDDFLPFRYIFNEMFIKDASKKVKASLNSRMKRGSCISSKPPYGYMLKKVNEGELTQKIILVSKDDETTEVVKEIYYLYLKGFGFGKIASYLNDKGIKPPSYYIDNFSKSKFCLWNNNTIRSILTNPKYGGYMYQGQYQKLSYKQKAIVKVKKQDWIYGGEFEGIIDKETFNLVQSTIRKRGEKKYRYKNGVVHPFSGVLKCTSCNGSMSYRKNYDGYKCTNSQMGKNRCTAHSIKEADLLHYLKQILKDEISKVDKQKYYNLENIVIKNTTDDELKQVKKELESLSIKVNKIYDDRISGVLSEMNFKSIIEDIQIQQQKLNNRKVELEDLSQKDKQVNIYEIYKKEIDRLLNFDEIDRNIVEKLVDRIEVTEIKGTKEKRVDFFLKYKKLE